MEICGNKITSKCCLPAYTEPKLLCEQMRKLTQPPSSYAQTSTVIFLRIFKEGDCLTHCLPLQFAIHF